MEQNVASNDWRVLARTLSNGSPGGTVVPVSQINSRPPLEITCSFGTNYLVAWGSDEEPHSLSELGFSGSHPTNIWFVHLYGRMLTPQGTAFGNGFPIIRANGTNSPVTRLLMAISIWYWRIGKISLERTREYRFSVLMVRGRNFPFAHLATGTISYHPRPPGSALAPAVSVDFHCGHLRPQTTCSHPELWFGAMPPGRISSSTFSAEPAIVSR
jgi:hypothetical protein